MRAAVGVGVCAGLAWIQAAQAGIPVSASYSTYRWGKGHILLRRVRLRHFA